MDSSKVATQKTTIASRRPMLTSQRSLSSLVINTSATHKDFTKKDARYHRLHTPPSVPPLPVGMSPEELSSKIADSFQQFSNMLSQLSTVNPQQKKAADFLPPTSTSPLPTSVLPQHRPLNSNLQQQRPLEVKPIPVATRSLSESNRKLEEEFEEMERKYIRHTVYHEHALDGIEDSNVRQFLLTKWLNRAASVNDLEMLKLLAVHPEVDINKSDDIKLGVAPFMYAAYFGYTDSLKFFLNQPSLNINSQDKKGWTALIWAVHGNQLESVKLLLDYGIDTSLKTKRSKTVFDYPCQELIKLELKQPPSIKSPTTPIPTTKALPLDVDFYYQTSIDGYNHYLNQTPTVNEPVDIQSWEDTLKSITFHWDRCLHDQMFVFSEHHMSAILDHALYVPDAKALMNHNQLSIELWQPANVVFLSARFAHYCYNRKLLNDLLLGATTKISKIIKNASRDTNTLAYWIANLCQLSSYLKKDTGLAISTVSTQTTLSELISEAYTYFISESQKKLEKNLESCILEFGASQDQIDFADDWQRFFRRSSSSSAIIQPGQRSNSLDEIRRQSSEYSPEQPNSPHAITHQLDAIRHTLQTYHVPPAIVIQAMAQFFHYLSCELFNRILTFKKYLCRSKALQIRINLSILEDWVKASQLPASLNQSLEPLVQLLQLLQCLSQLEDVLLFSSTVQTFDKLNPLQIKRCVQNYRYEISETKLTESVEKLANDWVIEFQKEQELKKSHLNIEDKVKKGKRPESVSSLDSLISSHPAPRLSMEQLDELQPNQPEIQSTEEKRNSKYLLPFSVLNTTALLHDWNDEQLKAIKTKKNHISSYSDTIYKEMKFKKQEQVNILDKIFPEISQEWLYNLDKKLYA